MMQPYMMQPYMMYLCLIGTCTNVAVNFGWPVVPGYNRRTREKNT
jgi:hypothetical protein